MQAGQGTAHDPVRRGHKRFPNGTTAVHDLTLEMPEGGVTVLVGSSGCGKTTTLRMINRMVEPTSGTISVGGTDILRADAAELRRGIGYVIQQSGPVPAPHHPRQHRDRAAAAGLGPAQGPGPGGRAAGDGRPAPPTPASATRTSSPAASSSASAWPARWPPTRRCC